MLRQTAAGPEPLAQAVPTLAEIFAATAWDGAATAFMLAHLNGGAVLWVQDRLSRREAGMPYPPGFGVGLDLMYLQVGRAADVLWAMEQGLGTPSLAAVVGEVWGDAPALDFTATKRLALRAEAHGVAAWLIRRGAMADLSAARERWRVGSLPSAPHPDDLRAPGAAIWRTTLFRARWRMPADWVTRYDARTHRMQMEHPTAATPGPQAALQAG